MSGPAATKDNAPAQSKGMMRLLAIGGAAVAGLVAFGALFAWIVTGEEYGPDKQLDLAMKQLEHGRWDLADRIARDLEKAGQLTPAREPVWNYIRGAAVCCQRSANWMNLAIAGCCGTRPATWKNRVRPSSR